MSRAAPPGTLWLVAGVAALAVIGVAAYFSLPWASRNEPSYALATAPAGLPLRVHPVPRELHDLAFEDDTARKRTLSEFRGRLVLLNIWATWCVPCRKEMPAMDRLQEKLGGPGFEVLALSIDAGGAPDVKRFYDRIGIRSLAIYVDRDAGVTASVGAVGVPITLLIDPQGREIGRHTGPAQWDSPEAVEQIQRYLKGSESR